MNKWVFALACVLALLGTADGQSYVVVSGNSMPITSPSNLMVDYALSAYDPTLGPGDTGTITLIIRNTGSQRAEDVQLYIPDVPNIKAGKSFFLGTISAQSTATVSLTYTISPKADIGIITLPVMLTYDGYDSDAKRVNNIQANYDFPLKVYGNPKLSIEAIDFGDIDIGSAFNVTIRLKNQDREAYKAVATLGGAEQSQMDMPSMAQAAASQGGLAPLLAAAQSTPALASGLAALSSTASAGSSQEKAITILGSDRKFIGSIGPGETVPVTFTLYVSDRAVSGAYSLPLTIDYENKGRAQLSDTFNIGVYVTGKPQVSFSNVKTDPNEIRQDERDVEVKVTVENIGTKEVDNFRMTLEPAGPFKNARSYVQTQELGSVKTQDSSTVSFYVDVDKGAKQGLYPLTFLVEYKLGTKHVNETKTVQIALKDSPDFQVASPPISAAAGEKGRIQAKVTNNGKKCESVTLWVMKKSDQPFDFDDKSQYIGDLDAGESGEAALTFTTDAAAKAQEYLVPMEIRCTLDDKVEVYSASARVTVAAAGRLDNVPAALVAAVAVAAALAVWAAKNRLSGRGKDKTE